MINIVFGQMRKAYAGLMLNMIFIDSVDTQYANITFPFFVVNCCILLGTINTRNLSFNLYLFVYDFDDIDSYNCNWIKVWSQTLIIIPIILQYQRFDM